MKKLRMVDIAKMCNVSVATVSYVLNNKPNSRIPEETKQKILQMANLFMYRSNPYARSLAMGEFHNILFFYKDFDFIIYHAEVLYFINLLSNFLRPFKYNIIIAPNNMIAKYNYVDAIITYRVDLSTFKELGNLNFIPLISVDCHINDNLFFEINNSFNNLKMDNNIAYLTLPYHDQSINELLLKRKNVYLIKDFTSLKVITTSNKEIICLNYELFKYLSALNVTCSFLDLNTDSKFKAIVDSLKLSINKDEVNNHSYLID